MTAVVVTGGGGFLGFEICRQLRDRGYRVRSFSRSRYDALARIGVDCVQGDLAKPADVARAIEGAEAVVHCAAKAGYWGAASDYFRTNVCGTENVVAACRSQGVGHLVYTSSPSVAFDGRHDIAGQNEEQAVYPKRYYCHYSYTKSLAERAVLAQDGDGLRTCALRPHQIWGPGDPHFLPRLVARRRSGRLAMVGSLQNRVDVIHVANAASAHVLALEKLASSEADIVGGRAYFLGQDQPVNLWQFVNQLLGCADLPPVDRHVSFRLAYRIGHLLEWLYRPLPASIEPPMTRFVASIVGKSHYFSHDRAKRELGYRCLVTTDEGLEELRLYLRSRNFSPTPAQGRPSIMESASSP